jgi:glutamate-1-semialdehyde 2,1-aminomutase
MTKPSPIIERYLARTPASARRNAEATRTMPGGDTRSTAWFPPYPPFAVGGAGAALTDLDGNRYVELLNNYTALIHGHAHPVVVEAIREQLGRGACFAGPHERTLQLSQMLCERVASIEHVRFTNSGTEAVMMAARVARAFTGRPLVAKAEGGYHGTWDDVQIGIAPQPDPAWPHSPPASTPDSPGLSPGATQSTVVIPYNDLEATRAILEPVGSRLAAVVVEPMQGTGMIPADPDYLHGLRALTGELGALLVLDEVMMFRLAPGGLQSHYGVAPDLTTIGKIIGGGLPVGAFGGRADVMEVCDPRRPGAIPHYGTFNGNAATMAGGVASLELLPPAEYERINALGERLRDGVNALGAELGLAICATGIGSLLDVHLTNGPLRCYRDVVRGKPWADLLHLALLNEGLFAARRGLMAISTPMDEELIDDVIEKVRSAVLAVHAEQPIAELAIA